MWKDPERHRERTVGLGGCRKEGPGPPPWPVRPGGGGGLAVPAGPQEASGSGCALKVEAVGFIHERERERGVSMNSMTWRFWPEQLPEGTGRESSR